MGEQYKIIEYSLSLFLIYSSKILSDIIFKTEGASNDDTNKGGTHNNDEAKKEVNHEKEQASEQVKDETGEVSEQESFEIEEEKEDLDNLIKEAHSA